MNRQQLEARKRVLVAESEAYRQTLRLEVAQLQLHAEQLKRRFRLILFAQPLVALLPLVIKLVTGRKARIERNSRSKFGGMLNAALIGWRLARRFAPLISSFRRRARPRGFASDHRARAASGEP
jgi:hypothetical protein